MSNSNKAVQEIKNLMVQFGFMSEDKTLLSFKLEDNTIVETAKLEKDSKIFKINECKNRNLVCISIICDISKIIFTTIKNGFNNGNN